MSAEVVTTVNVYIGEAARNSIDQPGFYDRLRELLSEFGVVSNALIAIDESTL